MRKHPGHNAFMANPKIDKDTARKIEAEAKHWPQRVLVKRYGLSPAQIGRIIRGEAWANIA